MAENEQANDAEKLIEDFHAREQQEPDRFPIVTAGADARVRVLGPDSQMYRIPEDQLDQALAEGGRVMDAETMRTMRHEIFMKDLAFRDKQKPAKKRKRRSIVIGGRR